MKCCSSDLVGGPTWDEACLRGAAGKGHMPRSLDFKLGCGIRFWVGVTIRVPAATILVTCDRPVMKSLAELALMSIAAALQ